MPELRVRPMTEQEFAAYRTDGVRSYAESKVRAGQWRSEEALARSAETWDELLPDGLGTERMLVRAAERPDGTLVGWLVLGLSGPDEQDRAYIYDIKIAERHRGRGYGRALLEAAGREVAQHGVCELELNVFGANAVARSLYESAGYETVAVLMRKRLVD